MKFNSAVAVAVFAAFATAIPAPIAEPKAIAESEAQGWGGWRGNKGEPFGRRDAVPEPEAQGWGGWKGNKGEPFGKREE